MAKMGRSPIGQVKATRSLSEKQTGADLFIAGAKKVRVAPRRGEMFIV